MKKQIVGNLIVILGFLFVITESAAAQIPTDLVASDPQFTYDIHREFNRSRNYSMLSTDSPVQRLSALFRNTGSKAIKSVFWEYITFKDRDEKELSRVFSIHNNRTILPGESVRLIKQGYRLPDSQYKRVHITRIKYADGTIWQGMKTKN